MEFALLGIDSSGKVGLRDTADMTRILLNLTMTAAVAFGCKVASRSAFAATPQDNWQQLTAVGGGSQSRLAFSHWPNDKYPGRKP